MAALHIRLGTRYGGMMKINVLFTAIESASALLAQLSRRQAQQQHFGVVSSQRQEVAEAMGGFELNKTTRRRRLLIE
jgi:hypothetical protein